MNNLIKKLIVVVFIIAMCLGMLATDVFGKQKKDPITNPIKNGKLCDVIKSTFEGNDDFFFTHSFMPNGQIEYKGYAIKNSIRYVGETCIEHRKTAEINKQLGNIVTVIDLTTDNTHDKVTIIKKGETTGEEITDKSFINLIKTMAKYAHDSIANGEEDYIKKCPNKSYLKRLVHTHIAMLHKFGVCKDVGGGLTNNESKAEIKNDITDKYRARFIFVQYGAKQSHMYFCSRKEKTEYGDLEVKKVDEANNNIALPNVKFKLKTDDGKYVRAESTGISMTTGAHQLNTETRTYKATKEVTKEGDATEFKTGAEGKTIIKNLVARKKYQAIEVSNPNFGYGENYGVSSEPVQVEAKKTVTLTFTNKLKVGKLKIVKVDKNNESHKLQGVEFKIKSINTGKYIKAKEGASMSTGAHQQSTEERKYEVPLNEDNYRASKEEATTFITDKKGEILIENLVTGKYEIEEVGTIDHYVMSTENSTVEIKSGTQTESKIYNEQTSIDLSGFVWVDKQTSKTSTRNDLYKSNKHPSINDYVDDNDILLDGITVRLMDKRTHEEVKDKNGNPFKATTADGGKYLFKEIPLYDSNDKDRKNIVLYNYYVEFEYDGLTYTNVVPHLENEKNGSKSAENNTTRDNFNKNFSVVEGKTSNTGITRDSSGNEKYTLNYNIDENEHKSTLINNGQYPITANTTEAKYNINEHFKPGVTEIKYINLGLYEREQPDLALVKDLQSVKVAVNGYNHIYEYAQRFKNQGEYGDGFNVGVKFGSKYGDMSYSRAIYKSDYEYTSKDSSKELKVYITYKIAVKNQSTNLLSQVNSIVDYYDSKYTLTKVGTELNNGEVKENNLERQDSKYNDKYAKTVINTSTLGKIEAQSQRDIYVQFELNREAVLNILNEKSNLNNVAEINSYSVFDTKGKEYAGIDIDSNPGNADPENKATFQDDTDSAPGLLLEVAENARKMTGKVFLDSTSGELKVKEERKGSGAYEEGEKGIEGVKVTLKENVENGKVYDATTDNEGNYLISGFIPGDYTLTFTWGDKTYTVQDYKGTIYNSSRDQNDKSWYKKDVDTPRLTDAIDDYELRKKIDNGEDINKMNSTTPTMGITVEITDTNTTSFDDKFIPQGYNIKNIDFGIVERPRQSLDISKKVKTFKVTLANGQVIVDAKVNDNGKLDGQTNHLTYMAPSSNVSPKNGYVKLELDNELIQGATVQIGYEIKVSNNSELDYSNEDYYKYGTIKDNLVKVRPTGVYDYLDSTMVMDETANNGNWEVVDKSSYDKTYTGDTITEKYFKEGKTTDEEGNTIYKWETSSQIYETIYTEWSTANTEKIRDVKLQDKTILHNADLEGEMKPGDSKVVELHTSKVLANSDEINLNNDAEIIDTKIITETGRKITPKVSKLYDRAEEVIVTPNTGEDKNFVIPTIVCTVALVILGLGVVLIKKKVVDNK